MSLERQHGVKLLLTVRPTRPRRHGCGDHDLPAIDAGARRPTAAGARLARAGVRHRADARPAARNRRRASRRNRFLVFLSRLAELGVHCPAPMIVNGRFSCTSRLYEVNRDLNLDWKTARETTPSPGTRRGGTVSSVDGHRWFVTLCGADGGTLRADFADPRRIPEPVIWTDLIGTAAVDATLTRTAPTSPTSRRPGPRTSSRH